MSQENASLKQENERLTAELNNLRKQFDYAIRTQQRTAEIKEQFTEAYVEHLSQRVTRSMLRPLSRWSGLLTSIGSLAVFGFLLILGWKLWLDQA